MADTVSPAIWQRWVQAVFYTEDGRNESAADPGD